MMIYAVENGYATDAAIDGLVVGGKTGTAETGATATRTPGSSASPANRIREYAVAVLLEHGGCRDRPARRHRPRDAFGDDTGERSRRLTIFALATPNERGYGCVRTHPSPRGEVVGGAKSGRIRHAQESVLGRRTGGARAFRTARSASAPVTPRRHSRPPRERRRGRRGRTDRQTRSVSTASDPDELFGLYEGTPLVERGSGYTMTLPDKITIFRGPLLRAFCRSPGNRRRGPRHRPPRAGAPFRLRRRRRWRRSVWHRSRQSTTASSTRTRCRGKCSAT